MNTQLNTLREAAVMPAPPIILPAVIEETARRVFETFSEKMKQSLNGRQDRALKLALEGHVTHKAARIFNVRSENNDHSYLVDLDHNFCTCPDSQNGNPCKHRLSAYIIWQSMQAAQSKAEVPPEPGEPESKVPPSTNCPITSGEEALEKARLVLEARSQFLKESIIYARLPLDGEMLPVEVINLEGEVALVRALPRIQDEQLIPQFPFPEKQSAALVLAKSLTEVQIYR